MPRFKEATALQYIAPKCGIDVSGWCGDGNINIPLHSHSLAMDHRRNSPVLLQSTVCLALGSNVMVAIMVRLFGIDGQRNCLAYSFIADSSLSWVVSPSSITWKCSGRGIPTTCRRILGSSSIVLHLHLSMMVGWGPLANFVVCRRLSNIHIEDGNNQTAVCRILCSHPGKDSLLDASHRWKVQLRSVHSASKIYPTHVVSTP
jgi:hypothetical protein